MSSSIKAPKFLFPASSPRLNDRCSLIQMQFLVQEPTTQALPLSSHLNSFSHVSTTCVSRHLRCRSLPHHLRLALGPTRCATLRTSRNTTCPALPLCPPRGDGPRARPTQETCLDHLTIDLSTLANSHLYSTLQRNGCEHHQHLDILLYMVSRCEVTWLPSAILNVPVSPADS